MESFRARSLALAVDARRASADPADRHTAGASWCGSGIRVSAAQPPATLRELRALLDAGPDLVALLGPAGHVRFVSAALAAWLGRSPGELEGLAAGELLRPEQRGLLCEDARLARAGQPVSTRLVQLRHANGEWLSLRGSLAPLWADAQQQPGALFRGQPLSDPVLPAPADSRFDVLTALPNRVAFLERLQRWIERARRSPAHAFALLILDLDRFRRVNDSLGHHAGDRMVALVGRRLAACVRPGDLVARVGGDSFAVLVECLCAADEARLVSERVQRALSEPFLVEGHEVYASVSVGASFSSPEQVAPLQVLREAEAAMYAAKQRGGGRLELFDGRLLDAGLHLRLETGLRRALERGEFRAHYQPILSLASGQIATFEVLARWQDPERGLLPPSEFIHAAEETGLIVSMADLLLREACAQARRWQVLHPERPPIGISMNVTSSHFERADVATTLCAALAASGLDPALLTVEITESVMMRDVEAVLAALRELRARGVHVHLDDFGTGYSSLSYLHRLPCDAIKIDRSFIGGMERERDTALLVRAIVDLAHGLGRSVVAEGVETREQLAALQALGCEYVQGFLFSRPLDAAGVVDLLAAPPAWLAP